MIDEGKVRLMTKAALIQKKEEHNAIAICNYRKDDYVAMQTIKAWAACTVAWLILSIAVVVYIVGADSLPDLSGNRAALCAIIWVCSYVVFSTVGIVAARVCFAGRYRKAAASVRSLKDCLMELEDYIKSSIPKEAEGSNRDDGFA